MPRQRLMTNPSGLRHSSRQRSRSGLNCHRPAARSVVRDDRAVGARRARGALRPPRGCRGRRARRPARTRPRRPGSRASSSATSRPGCRRRPTSAPKVMTSGTLDGSIIATIISSQPTTKSDGLERQRACRGRVVQVRRVRRALPTSHRASQAASARPTSEPAQDRAVAPRDAEVGGGEHRASRRPAVQAAKRKWPCRALWSLRSTLGMPCGLPSFVYWLALLA